VLRCESTASEIWATIRQRPSILTSRYLKFDVMDMTVQGFVHVTKIFELLRQCAATFLQCNPLFMLQVQGI
jgi:hypothetical protein